MPTVVIKTILLIVKCSWCTVCKYNWNNSAETRMRSKEDVKMAKNVIMSIHFLGVIISSCSCSNEKN